MLPTFCQQISVGPRGYMFSVDWWYVYIICRSGREKGETRSLHRQNGHVHALGKNILVANTMCKCVKGTKT